MAEVMQNSVALKEACLSYFTSDKKQMTSQDKRESYWKVTNKKLQCFDVDDKNEKEISLKPREISKIVEPEKNFLCIEYGPKKKPMYIFLNFGESRDSLDEWFDAINIMMGARLRTRTENVTTMQRRPKPKPARPRPLTATQQLYTPPEEESPDGTAMKEAPAFPALENHSLDEVSEVSPPSSLHSDVDDNLLPRMLEIRALQEQRDAPHVELDVLIEELRRFTFADYKNKVYASDCFGDSSSTLNIGDHMLEVDSAPVTSAENLLSIIQDRDDGIKITAKLQVTRRGQMCATRARDWEHLGIKVNGREITQMGGEFRMACDPSWESFDGHRSTRSITAINNHPVPLDSTSQQVKDLIIKALNEDELILIHVHPTAFLTTLAPFDSTNL